MGQFGIYILLISITVSIMHTNGNARNGKSRTIAMKLIFLNTYCQLVATHGYCKVNESKRTEFMDTWELTLGRENAEEVLEKLEAHWMYALDIVTNPIPNLTALVVTTVVRIMALQDGLTYLICVMYYKQAEIEIKPEHCRKRAAYLIIFSHLHIVSLVPKLLRTRWFARGFIDPSPNWLNMKTLLDEWKKVVLMSQGILVTNLQPKQKKYGEALNLETDNNIFDRIMSQLERTHRIVGLSDIAGEKTLLLIMFGMTYCTYYYLQDNTFFRWKKEVEISMWNLSLEIDISSIQKDKKDAEKYFITDLIRENIIWSSEINQLSRHDFIEQFEIMKPDKFEVWYEDQKFNNTALIIISSTF